MDLERRTGGLMARLAGLEPTATPDPRVILSSIGQAVYDWNLVTDRLTWTGNVAAVLGGPAETGAAFASLCDGGLSRHAAIWDAAERDTGTGVPFATRYGFTGGTTPLWVDDCGRWFADADGRPLRAHGVIRTTPRPAEVLGAGGPDPLTGLLGRAAFEAAVARRLAAVGRDTVPFAILLVADDSVPALNQQDDDAAGDRALVATAARLRCLLRAADVLARYGGATFALLLDHADPAAACAAAQRLKKAAESLHIAVATSPGRGRAGGAKTAATLCRKAEAILDEARGVPAEDRRRPAPRRPRHQAARLTEAVVDRLNDRTLAVSIDPCVDASGQAVFWLARPLLGQNEVALARLVDWRCIEQAVKRLAADESLHLAVPLSSAFFRDPEAANRLRDAFAFQPGATARLTLIAEDGGALAEPERTAVWMAALRRQGVKLGLAGAHASPRVLQSLAPDLLVIAGALIQALPQSPDNRFLVRSILDMAQTIGVKTLAPWVEAAETAAWLTAAGATFQTGTLFAAYERPARVEVAA